MTDTEKTHDAVIDFAKDLLMHDFAPLLQELDAVPNKSPKGRAFHSLVVVLHAARAAADDFRLAHIEAEKVKARNAAEAEAGRLAEMGLEYCGK